MGGVTVPSNPCVFGVNEQSFWVKLWVVGAFQVASQVSAGFWVDQKHLTFGVAAVNLRAEMTHLPPRAPRLRLLLLVLSVLLSMLLLLLTAPTPATARRQLIPRKTRELLLAQQQSASVMTTALSPPSPIQHLPVFFFHGVLSNAKSGYRFAANLTAEGRVFIPLTFCDDRCSVQALNNQVQLAIAQIRAIVKDDPRFDDGYVFIGHSQGGAIARAVIQEMDDHKVQKFISLAGVVNGVFYGPQPADKLPLLIFLNGFGQKLVPSSLWDPSRYSHDDVNGTFQYDLDAFSRNHPELQDQYSAFNLARSPVPEPWVSLNNFLPRLNNISPCTGVATCQSDQKRRRENFLRLEAAHFFASPDDGVVAPWQSSVLGQYSELTTAEEIKTKFSTLHVLDMKDTREYQQDTYGLQTLDARGGLFRHVVANVPHTCWVTDSAPFGSVHPCFFDEIYDERIYRHL